MTVVKLCLKIAILTGGTVITEDMGRKLDSVELEDLGTARQVRITKDETTIIDGVGDKEVIAKRVNQIRAQVEETTSEFDREKLQDVLLNCPVVLQLSK